MDLKGQKRELDDLQRKLEPYASEVYIDLDPTIKNVLDGDVPDWLSNVTVFSPITVIQQSEIYELADIVRGLQNKLRRLVREAERTSSTPEHDYDEEIRRLEEVNKELSSDVRSLAASEYSYTTGYDSGSQQLGDIENEIAMLRHTGMKLEDEIALLENGLSECLAELTQAQEVNEVLKEQLTQSMKDMKGYRVAQVQLKQTGEGLNAQRKKLYERGHKLANVITKLQLTKSDNEKTIRKLEEAFADHQQLVASYRLLEDKIKEQEKQQEIALSKMVDAVELAEEAAAEAQKNRMTRDSLTEELQRVKTLTVTTTRQFDEAFGEHEAGMKKHFEGILSQIKERSATLEAENSQLSHDRESVQRQLETATQENSILKTARSDNGFSDFVETMAQLKAEIEAAYAKKEQLIALNERTQMNINEVKAKLVMNASSGRSDQLDMNQRSQKLEMEIEMHKATCKDMLAKNAKLTADNQKIRSDIVRVQRSANSEIQNRLKDKDRELDEVKAQIDSTQRANAKALSEMQQAIMAFRQHADKWKCKAQSIGIEANDAKQSVENEQQQMIDQINDLEEQLQKRKQLKAKCELMLQQMNDQIKTLKQNVNMTEKKYRQQANTITQLVNQQHAFSAEKGRDEGLLESITVKVKRQQRALSMMGKGVSIDDSF